MDLIPFPVGNLCLESYFVKITSRSKIIYWIIICIIITGIAILPFVYIDVSVQARGYFQSEIERQMINTPFQGKVIYSSIENGKRINKGDTLLIIDSESIRAQLSSIHQRISENSASIQDLEKLTASDSLDLSGEEYLLTPRYKAELSNLNSRHAIQLQKYNKRKIEYQRNKLLHDQHLIPAVDYENSLFELNSEKDNLDQILIYQKSLWQNDLTVRINDLSGLNADYEQCREALADRIILAPVDGEIIRSSDIQAGTIISQGENIAEITPDGELIATCFVRPSDIGLIHPDQKVRLQVDAFNHNEWGMLDAKIIDISDDMLLENGSAAFFKVKCRPEKTHLSLKNGYTAYVKKGMSINARIFVIRRSLFNLMFDKADKWFNPYSYNK